MSASPSACDCLVGVPTGPTLASTCGGSAFMLFMGLLEVFIRSQCDLEDPCGRASSRVSDKYLRPQRVAINITYRFHYFTVSIGAGLRVRFHCHWWRLSGLCGCLTTVRGAPMEGVADRSR